MNGHIPVRKRYIESSLDELAMEIEAYEHREERPKPAGYHSDAHEEPELPKEPPSPPVVIATPEAGPSRETEQKEEEEAMTIVELLKTTEEVQLLTFYFLHVLPTYLCASCLVVQMAFTGHFHLHGELLQSALHSMIPARLFSFCLNRAPPGSFRFSSSPFPFWCPVHCYVADVVFVLP